MKKIILTLAAVFALTFANAQNKDKKGSSDAFTYGVKAGLNFSNITGPSGYSTATGINIGGLADFKIDSKFSIQPELLYSMQGAKYDGGDAKYNYINIPVMVKYYVADAFSLQAGPQIGFLSTATSGGTDVKSNSSSTDFGFNLGLGYNITDNFLVDLRYNIGLSKINKDSVDGVTDSKNSVISINFGYKFF